jgi:hypothetical protein
MDTPAPVAPPEDVQPKLSSKKVRKDGSTALIVQNAGNLLEVPEGNRLYPRGGVSETGAAIDPRPIPWVVFLSAIPLVLGYATLMTRLIFGMSSGWQEMSLLALHAAGSIAVLVAYFGKSTRVAGVSTRGASQ